MFEKTAGQVIQKTLFKWAGKYGFETVLYHVKSWVKYVEDHQAALAERL